MIRVRFRKASMHEKLPSTDKSYSTETCYQPKLYILLQLVPHSVNHIAKQYFLLNRFMKLGPDNSSSGSDNFNVITEYTHGQFVSTLVVYSLLKNGILNKVDGLPLFSLLFIKQFFYYCLFSQK